MEVKYVLLDLGGVVFNSTGISNSTINWSVISKLNHKYGHDLNIGEDRFGDFMKEYNRLTSLNISGQDFLKSVFDTLEFNQEIVEFIRKKYQSSSSAIIIEKILNIFLNVTIFQIGQNKNSIPLILN